MGYLQSPGIEVKEFDVSTIVPGVSTTEAAIGGVFSWGPVEDRELVSTENELRTRYGAPTDDNFETYFSASNFLAYSDALWVSRAADANAFNARVLVPNTTAANTQIKNDTHFSAIQSGLSANVAFFARYPGTLGNGLKVAVCPSANAYSETLGVSATYNTNLAFVVDSNTAQLSVSDASGSNNAIANTGITDIVSKLNVGDYVQVASSGVGSQALKVTAISNTAVANGVATATVSFETRYKLSANVNTNAVSRLWEFYNFVEKAPGTSTYATNRGGVGDELHVIVVDTLGKFTGQPNTIVERFEGLSRAVDATGEQGGSIYYKEVLNNSSVYIYANAPLPGVTTVNTAATSTAIAVAPFSSTFAGGTDSLSETAIPLNAIARAYDQFINPDDVDISIIIGGKSAHGVHGEGLANYIIDNIISVRKDCVLTVSPQISDVVNNPYGEAEALVQLRGALRSTSYATFDTLYKWQYDQYNNKYRWIPGSGDIAGLMARTDRDRDPWYSHAGEERGTIKNIVRLAYNPDHADRDLLYKNDINAVINKKGAGIILYGDKTLYGKPSAFDRMNVRRLFITLQKAIKIAANALLFEFNDEYTRARFRNMVQPYLRDVQGRRGITAFKVVCDDTNNTGTVIDANRFIGDIYIKPARSINFITLNFVAVGTDVSFDEVAITQ
ncbi:putative tail sheath protein [Rhizobium phage RHph_I1_18]|nr:putative tail sheath protein [Rhizobium phage RHph_I1_18]